LAPIAAEAAARYSQLRTHPHTPATRPIRLQSSPAQRSPDHRAPPRRRPRNTPAQWHTPHPCAPAKLVLCESKYRLLFTIIRMEPSDRTPQPVSEEALQINGWLT